MQKKFCDQKELTKNILGGGGDDHYGIINRSQLLCKGKSSTPFIEVIVSSLLKLDSF